MFSGKLLLLGWKLRFNTRQTTFSNSFVSRGLCWRISTSIYLFLDCSNLALVPPLLPRSGAESLVTQQSVNVYLFPASVARTTFVVICSLRNYFFWGGGEIQLVRPLSSIAHETPIWNTSCTEAFMNIIRTLRFIVTKFESIIRASELPLSFCLVTICSHIARGSALCYKPGGLKFETRWIEGLFLIA
jgi:hypothetical protein